jgi:hypothetical protein
MGEEFVNPLRNLRSMENAEAARAVDMAGAVTTLQAHATSIASDLALAGKLPFDPVYKQLLAAFFIAAKGTAPTVAEMDARTAKWRTRIRLYDAREPDEVMADTDPDLPPGNDGAMVRSGLPAVAEWLAEVATDFHGETLGGLDMPTLRHKLKALRPTLSRRGGNAVWRVRYTSSRGEWLARVDVVRVPA